MMANLNVANKFGDTMLHFAAKANQTQVVKYLMLRGFDTRATNKFFETAAFYAAEAGNVEILMLLLKDKRTQIDH